ncbi:MAG: tetratricopeptide repeat protein [Pedosphaera sp.]|nr:tetratricopeptide repeat protein [Pedosphaera sp.]
MSEQDSLGHPDIFHLRAAIGWLELGNATEAAAELERIAPELHAHPGVLLARLDITMHLKDWPTAESVALRLTELRPDVPGAWIGLAYARRRMPAGGVKSAYDALVPVGDEFPKEPTIPFNLACYACLLNELGVARAWLQKAFRCGEEKMIREMALNETDLEPLWPWIRERPPSSQR